MALATAQPVHWRSAGLALLASAALHAAILVAPAPHRTEPGTEPLASAYEATLVRESLAEPAPVADAAAPAPAPRPAKPARRRARPGPPLAHDILAALPGEATQAASSVHDVLAELSAPALLAEEPVLLASVPELAAVPALEAAPFPVAAFPASVSIVYQLTSVVADGRAEYHWERDGDSYRIHGEAEAQGFVTLFLEGRILQESRGTVGARGLRPRRFTEQRPGAAEEGLEFDWESRQVTFDRGGERRTGALADNTVDWLSMIFQLAHVPPGERAFPLQVFTQRRMYRFELQVLGVEAIEIPLGNVRALHLRHEDTHKQEVVDVWLGIDHHYLPVKLRFPAARNRLMVEQVATRVRTSDDP
jgi:hypothetical protein